MTNGTWKIRLLLSIRLLPYLLNVFPVPRLIAVRAEAKPFGVTHQPLVNACLYLQGAVCIARINGFAANIEVEGATSEMGTIKGEPGASRVGRLSTQFFLILTRTKR